MVLLRQAQQIYIMIWKWYVYIIRCQDESYYTGLTYRPDKRWIQHLSKFGSKFTAKHKAERVVYLEEYEDLQVARLLGSLRQEFLHSLFDLRNLGPLL